MAISDCEKCWETPCRCGWEYRDWNIEQLNSQICMLQKILDQKTTISDFSDYSISGYFGLSYASWLTLPRVLMEAMPNNWQTTMGKLLREFSKEFPGLELNTCVRLVDKRGRFRKMENWMCNYRYPDIEKIKEIRKKT